MRLFGTLAIVALAGGFVPPAGGADLSDGLREACREALPGEMAREAAPDAARGEGPAGEWRIEAGQMDGQGSAEAILVILPVKRPGSVLFLGEREGKDPLRKKVPLKGAPIQGVTVTFEGFAEGRSLVHVDAGAGGQVLLHWEGGKLSTVWRVGKTREDERHWFNLEDLDGDGVSEVIAFFRRELDVFYTDERDVDLGGPQGQTRATEQVDAVAVYRYGDGRWKKDDDLLHALR